ncbi:MAG: 4Fe-4S binding protein [Armatimonadetes bacterium]|jgi:electron transport complex protein RnfB|nr:4Fe-4S binding protein [Armatimonadota bacterium]
MADNSERMSRREFLAGKVRLAGALAVCGGVALLRPRGAIAGTVWQIDPNKCTQCGKCATECVLGPSAVKCVHVHAMCGHCELCFGFFEAQPNALTTAAENQRCPTGAIKRRFIEDPYFEYVIDEPLCIGCGKCVEGCGTFGNGSLQLQVRHDRCENCNQCAIADACPSDAFVRVPATRPYLLKSAEGEQ